MLQLSSCHIGLFEDPENLVIVIDVVIIYIFVLQCRDTYWIESLHFVMLIYAQKRIHFGRADSYKMRMQLAILDWVHIRYDEFAV